MNTTPHDPFEDDLRALRRQELPAPWRDEILAAAATASALSSPAAAPASTACKPARRGAPRWLVVGWGMAWAASLALYLTTPATPEGAATTAVRASETPPLQWKDRLAAIQDLLAAN